MAARLHLSRALRRAHVHRASLRARRLNLRPPGEGAETCPIPTCIQGFKT